MTRRVAAWTLPVLFALASGCGGPKTGDVSGVVTHKGKPLVSGSVVFHCGFNSPPVTAAIGPDGRYAAKGVGIGAAKVGVYSPNPKIEADEIRAQSRGKPGTGGDAVAVPAGWFPVPDSYADPQNSGLSYTVPAGASEYDIDLK